MLVEDDVGGRDDSACVAEHDVEGTRCVGGSAEMDAGVAAWRVGRFRHIGGFTVTMAAHPKGSSCSRLGVMPLMYQAVSSAKLRRTPRPPLASRGPLGLRSGPVRGQLPPGAGVIASSSRRARAVLPPRTVAEVAGVSLG